MASKGFLLMMAALLLAVAVASAMQGGYSQKPWHGTWGKNKDDEPKPYGIMYRQPDEIDPPWTLDPPYDPPQTDSPNPAYY